MAAVSGVWEKPQETLPALSIRKLVGQKLTKYAFAESWGHFHVGFCLANFSGVSAVIRLSSKGLPHEINFLEGADIRVVFLTQQHCQFCPWNLLALVLDRHLAAKRLPA